MNQTEQITQHLLGILEKNPELTIDMKLSLDRAFFLLTQLLLLRHHHANQSSDTQRTLGEIVDGLRQTLRQVDPKLLDIVQGLQWESFLGATYSDLSPIHRIEFVKLQLLYSMAVESIAAEVKAPSKQVHQMLDRKLAQRRMTDLDVGQICHKSDQQLEKTADPYVLRKANALGLWNVGYYYYRQAEQLNFHLVGNYREKSTAITAFNLLRNCYPSLSWRILFVSAT